MLPVRCKSLDAQVNSGVTSQHTFLKSTGVTCGNSFLCSEELPDTKLEKPQLAGTHPSSVPRVLAIPVPLQGGVPVKQGCWISSTAALKQQSLVMCCGSEQRTGRGFLRASQRIDFPKGCSGKKK